MRYFRCAVMLFAPAALLAGAAIADPPAKTPPGSPKVGDRLAVFEPAIKLNSTGARKCETC